MILPCKCKSSAQDVLHGAGNRVMNYALKESKGCSAYRCTICKAIVKTNVKVGK